MLWMTRLVLAQYFSSVYFKFILSGIYPVFVLSSFKSSEVLKGKFIHSGSGILIRKVLVVFQLFIAICLITCTIFVFRQVRFLQIQDKGISISNILTVSAPSVRDASFRPKLLTFKENCLKTSQLRNSVLEPKFRGGRFYGMPEESSGLDQIKVKTIRFSALIMTILICLGRRLLPEEILTDLSFPTPLPLF